MPRSFGRHRATFELAREPHGEVADVDHLLHFAQSLGADLAHLDGDEVGERLLMLLDQLPPALDDRAAQWRWHGAPGEERRVRGVDCGGDIGGRCPAPRLKGGAVDRRPCLPVGARGHGGAASGEGGIGAGLQGHEGSLPDRVTACSGPAFPTRGR